MVCDVEVSGDKEEESIFVIIMNKKDMRWKTPIGPVPFSFRFLVGHRTYAVGNFLL